jgi:hypothetical protein
LGDPVDPSWIDPGCRSTPTLCRPRRLAHEKVDNVCQRRVGQSAAPKRLGSTQDGSAHAWVPPAGDPLWVGSKSAHNPGRVGPGASRPWVGSHRKFDPPGSTQNVSRPELGSIQAFRPPAGSAPLCGLRPSPFTSHLPPYTLTPYTLNTKS